MMMSSLVSLMVLCASGLCVAADAAATKRPNIVLIFADDQGWQDAGYIGSDFHETPNLDGLAEQGMVFRHAYAAMGNCAPSRACLLSGQYTPRHSVYAVGTTKRGKVELMRMLPVPNKGGLGAEMMTVGKTMKSAGYVTGMFGKWHLDGSGGSRPEQHFDVVKVSGHSWNKGIPDDPKGIYTITMAACEFMEENKDRPFFAYLPHYAVHTRYEARPDVAEKFKQKAPGKLHRHASYAACLSDFDTSVGMLLQKLTDLDLEQNTLVLLTSDNGGNAESQEPLRGMKGSFYEGGVRVPMIVRWPGVVQTGTTCDVPVINVDFYPTFLDVAGAKRSNDHPLDGESLLPLFKGKPALQRQSIFFHFPGYLNGPVPRGRDPVFRTRPVSVIRKGDWKLFLYHEEWQLDGGRGKLGTNGAVELYNLAEDAGERHNLAQSEPSKRDELLDDLLAWIERISAPLPTQTNPAYDPDKK